MPREFDLRFAVGDSGGVKSSVWRLWKSRTKDDIYITPRAAGAAFKISLHSDDAYCHLAITSEELVRLGGGQGRARQLTKWTRGVGPKDGLALALSMVFPAEFLSRTGTPTQKPVHLLPVPLTASSVLVDFVYTRLPDDQIGTAPNQEILGRIALSSGETLYIIAAIVGDFDAGAFRALHQKPAERFQTASLIQEPTSYDDDDLRGVIALPATTGALRLVEIGPSFFQPSMAANAVATPK